MISRRSLRTKAPLAAVALVLLVVGTLSAAAFLVLRNTLNANASARLTALSAQLNDSFKTSLAASRARVVAMATPSAVAAYVSDPTPDREALVRQAMVYTGPQPELNLRTEIRDAAGHALLAIDRADGVFSVPEGVIGAGPIEDWQALVASAEASPDGAVFGALRGSGGIIFFPTVARVPNRTDAYVVNWRRVGNSAQTRTMIANLFGSDAAFFYGNSDNTFWSESGSPTTAPPPSAQAQAFQFTRPGRGSILVVRSPIDGTPWSYSIEFPTQVVQAPAKAFLWTMSLIAAGCLAVSVVAAWIVGRSLARPIEALTSAAEAISRGETSHRIALDRDDEVGRLAATFNAMSIEVEESRRQLEAAVAARTGELRDAQESLARREKLALIGHLVSGIGHEIRNPLGVMANTLYFLETIQPGASDEVRRHHALLRQQINLCVKIVNDLLDLSRATPANRMRVHIDELLDGRLARIRTSADLESDIPRDLPQVIVDPVHAGQVLDNLLTNAVQAMSGEPGTVRIRARATHDGFVRVEVSDTGPGIAEEHFGKIFEPLFTTKAKGVGLGLALSKTLAQANGGDLTLVSSPLQSATFAFTLPAAPNATQFDGIA